MPDCFNPFPGLRPFDAEEDYLFFGREQQIAELLKLLRDQRFLSVIGTSGSGKSSLVRAGLLPELQGGALNQAGPNWEIVVLRPGGDPLNNLAAAIQDADLYDSDDPEVLRHLHATLAHSGFGLVEAIRQSEVEPDTNVLVVVDQFEEIFRFRRTDAESAALAANFVDLLLEATRQTDQPIYVVLTMRSDYLGDCTQFRGLTTAVNEGEYLIPRLTRDQIRTAIEGPVQVGGGEISFRLVQELLNSVGGNQDQLPILQHALMRTFDQWVSDRDADEPIDLRHYQDVGGMDEALSRHADEVFESLESDDHQLVAEKLFKALTEQQGDNRGIRRPTRMDALGQITGANLDTIEPIVEAFRAAGVTFLMPPSGTELLPETIVDISHESLMRVWRRLGRWVGDEVQSAQVYLRLSATAELHRAEQAGLYRGPDLQIALAWMDDAQPTPAWGERYRSGFHLAVEFLQASDAAGRADEIAAEAQRQRELEQARALADAEHQRAELQQKSVSRLRRLSGGVAIIALLALLASVFAFQARTRALDARQIAAEESTRAVKNAQEARVAEEKATASAKEASIQQEKAEDSRKTAEQARDTLNETLTRSYFLTANEHLESGATDTGLAYLARSLRTDSSYWPAANQIISVLSDHNHLLSEPFTIEMDQPINFAALEKGTRTFCWTLTTGRKGTLWNVKTRKKVGVFANGVRVDFPTFTKDASLVFVSLRDQGGSIRGFNTTDLKAATPLISIKNRINRPYFVAEPRPRVLRIVADQPGTNHFNIWDAVSGKVIGQQLSIADDSVVEAMQVTDDDRYVIASFRDKSLGVWNVEDAKLVFQSKTPTAVHLVTGKNCRHLVAVSKTGGSVSWIDLSAEKMKLETIDVGFVIENRNIHTGMPHGVVFGRIDTVLHVAVIDMANGKVTAKVSLEDYAAAGTPLKGNVARLESGDRGYVANGSWIGVFQKPDGTAVECRDLYTGKSVSTFDFSANPIESYLLPPDGLRLITQHEDFSVRVWNIINTLPLIDPIAHTLAPQVTMSRDGERLFTVTLDDMKVRAWSTRTGTPIQEGHAFSSSFVRSIESLADLQSMLQLDVTFFNSGSGRKLLYGKARAWKLESRQRAFPTLKFPGSVSGVTFSPDGNLFVAQTLRGLNSVAKIWNSKSLAEVRAFQLPNSGTRGRFSPDGTSVAIACVDGAVRIWGVETGERQTTIVLGEAVSDIRYTPNGKILVASTGSGRIRAFDAITGYGLHDAWDLQAATFDLNHNGSMVAAGNAAGDQFLIQMKTGEVTRLLPRALNGVSDITFSPDGSVVVSSPFGGQLRAWNTETHEVVFESPVIDYYTAAVFHPDGDVIAACASPQSKLKWGKIELWNWKKKTQISEPLMAKGQSDSGRIGFSHNGRLLAFGNFMGDISLWEYPTGAKLLSRSLGPNSQISAIDFSQDDRRLVVSGVVTSTSTGSVTMIDLPPMDRKSPGWLAEMAEVVAQRRIDENGESVVVDRSGLAKLQATIAAYDPDSPYRQWGLWYLATPDKRTVSPWSNQPASERLSSLLKSRNLSELYKALELDPNNGLAHAMIGYLKSVSMDVNDLKPHVVIHWKEMAQWHTTQAIDLDPVNPDVWALRALVMHRVGRLDELKKAVDTALKLDEENLLANYARSFLLHSSGEADMAFASFRAAYDKLPAVRPVYDWQNGRPFLPGILDTINKQRDRSPSSLAAAGSARVAQARDSLKIRRLELDWLTRLAVEIHPDDPIVWETRSNALLLAGRRAEAIQALARASDVDQNGNIDPLRVGGLIRNAANRLAGQTKFSAAHKFFLEAGIPKRSAKATARQIDLSRYYNQSLFDSVFRARDSESRVGKLWKQLPVGLVTLNGIEFDLRGVVRLVGADTAKQNFFSAPPRRVEKIAVNQKATWIHVLHNCSTLPGIPHGSPLGRYLLQFEDGTETTLPIRYGVHLVTWSGNPFAVPTHAIFGWREGDYSDTKTLSHCTWENPEPTKVIQAITFESAGAPGSPFLVAMSLESTAPSASDRDVASILREARLKSTMVNGATTLTFDHVLALLKQAQPMVRDNPGLKIQHAIANAENMKARGLHGDALKQIEGLTSNDKDVENSLLKLRGRIHHAAGEFQSATKMLAMSVDQEDYRVGKPVGLDHLLTERLFHRHIAAKGKREARDFVLRSQIPPRQPATSGSAIDLTKSYNAGLHETWQRPNNASVVMPPLYRTMRSGVHHFRGIPFDIRGVINLTGGTRFEIVFPPRVSNIVVNRKADQLHFLNGGFNQAVTGTPVAVYRVVYSDGKAVDFPVRFRIEIGDCWIAGATGNIPNLVWRGEGAAAFNRKKDTALYLATWDNPRPDVTISHVDFVATLKRVNPYLVAITAESFEGSLDNVALAPRQLAERAVHKASLPNVSKTLRQHAVKLSQRATKLAPEDAEVWRLQSEMFLALRRADDAATSIAQSLELDPESGPSLYTREKVLVQLGQTGEALRTRSRARKMTLKGRITARDKSLSHKYIDLTSHYNAALNENPFLESKRLPYIDEKLTGLTDGLGSYNGISFDVRGVIALHGSETQLREHVAVLTNGVEGIPIGQKARAIHLLHGTSWGFRVPHGTTIGKYNFHYKDGSTEFVDIRYGEHVLDWFLRKKRTATKAKLAHSQRSIREADREVGCYQMTWVNPKPDVPISHIDFVSYETEAAPFLLGITLDTGDKAAPKK